MKINASTLAEYINYIWLAVLISFASCNPTKNVPQGEYLLRSYNINVDNRSIERNQLRSYVQQKPNKKIVGARFHLWLYNSSKPEKNNWWNDGLRKNGEEPVIWDRERTDRTVDLLSLFLENKGYHHANVTDTVIFRKKKADVFYEIKTGWAYTINEITYSIPDTAIARLVMADTVNSLIKKGILLDVDILRAERKRIETNLNNNGYFSFVEDNIEYPTDTTNLDRKANITVRVKPHTEPTEDNRVIEAPYPLYNVRSLTVNASLNMQNMLESANLQRSISDTLKQGSVYFIMPHGFPVRASAINSAVYIFPGSLYKISDVNTTYHHLNGLRNFRQITSEFTEVQGQSGLSVRELDCMINLLPFTRQSYTVEIEGTNSEGNLGGGWRFQYQNRSLLGHAEIFDLRLRGLVEAVSSERTLQFKAKLEYEAEATLNIPKFLLPFPADRFTQRYNPKTAFSVLYNYQQYPEYYVRTVFSTSFGYNWRGNINSHVVKALDINFVQLPEQYLHNDFVQALNRFPYLKNSYQSHMIVSSSYSFLRDMRTVNRGGDSFFFRWNFETAGFLLDAFHRMSSQTKLPGETYEMFGNYYSQFIKTDVDLRYYFTVNDNNRIVVRTFAGIGFPYGNSRTSVTFEDTGATKTLAAMPFEKKYYAGGANSLRGWRLRSLGPGSYRDSVSFTSYPNNTGDIKLESNLEYRFNMIWLIEGALFADVGNVWDTHKDDDRPGANFSLDRFYREIALSAGFGLRFDFRFVILRTDLGMKLRDPAGSGRWAFEPKPDGSRISLRDDFCLSIGIGYPFF